MNIEREIANRICHECGDSLENGHMHSSVLLPRGQSAGKREINERDKLAADLERCKAALRDLAKRGNDSYVSPAYARALLAELDKGQS